MARSGFIQNLKAVKQLSLKERDQLISFLLKENMKDLFKETAGTSKRAGKPLRLSVGSKKSTNHPMISTN